VVQSHCRSRLIGLKASRVTIFGLHSRNSHKVGLTKTSHGKARWFLGKNLAPKVRPEAEAAVADAANYLILWLGLLFAELIRRAAALAGIDADVIHLIWIIEKWVWIASFGAFFCQVLIRAWRNIRRSALE
jgi:hypothetical protein